MQDRADPHVLAVYNAAGSLPSRTATRTDDTFQLPTEPAASRDETSRRRQHNRDRCHASRDGFWRTCPHCGRRILSNPIVGRTTIASIRANVGARRVRRLGPTQRRRATQYRLVPLQIGQMEMIPRRGSFMPFECCAGTGPLLDRAIRSFDPHALGSEYPARSSPDMLEYGMGLTSVDEGPPMSGKSLELKQGTREIKGNLDGPTKFLGQNSEFSSVDSRIRP
jgi:hypothetical protein